MLEDKEVQITGYQDRYTNGEGKWCEAVAGLPGLTKPLILIALGKDADQQIQDLHQNTKPKGRVLMDSTGVYMGKLSEEVRIAVRNFLLGHQDTREVQNY